MQFYIWLEIMCLQFEGSQDAICLAGFTSSCIIEVLIFFLSYLWLSFLRNAHIYILVLKADLKVVKWTHPLWKTDFAIAVPEVAIFACENT